MTKLIMLFVTTKGFKSAVCQPDKAQYWTDKHCRDKKGRPIGRVLWTIQHRYTGRTMPVVN